MQMCIKKVIRASAGTGKTYRLSLEYIALLLRYMRMGIHFSEILVITFTKKATAEIRDRIFSHLRTLTTEGEKNEELSANLAQILGAPITKEQLGWLRQTYHEMLTEKNRVQISTIDAFTYQIFKTVIAPYLGLAEHVIDPQAYKEYLNELYEYVLDAKHLPRLRSLFARSGHKSLQGYETLVRDILHKRWIFPLIENRGLSPDQKRANQDLERFQQIFISVLQQVYPLLAQKCATCSPDEVLRKNVYTAISQGETLDLPAWQSRLQEKLQDGEYLQANATLFLSGEPFWNGVRILNGAQNAEQRENLKKKLKQAGVHLADYLYWTVFLQEQRELEEISRLLLEKYDEILFREKRFNYMDILYHTYKHLYDPELSLIRGDEVSNTFYEVLTTRIRFLLIDEFQDTSILQFKLFLPILKEITGGSGVKEYGGVIVVGDEKQSIYGWRGGERDFILKMPEIMPETEELQLTTSFRHSPALIDFVNGLYGSQELAMGLQKQHIFWPYQACSTAKRNDGYVEIRFRNHSTTVADDGNEKTDPLVAFVQDVIRPRLQQGQALAGQTAILARENDDLIRLAEVLDEHGINYMLASSRSIFEHRAVKPLLFLFRFLVYQDISDLARFFRSDYIRLDGTELQQLLLIWRAHEQNRIQSHRTFLQTLREQGQRLPGVTDLFKYIDAQNRFDLFDSCLQALDYFHATAIFPLETDLVNINFFLEIVAGFGRKYRTYPATWQGLLQFSQDHLEDENLQQVGLEQTDAVNLLTIHKSKGLEYDSVFLFWDLSNNSGHGQNSLHEYLTYQPDYRTVKDFALAYNTDAILTAGSRRYLAEENGRKKLIEDMNTFYVAMTRPRQNLFVYAAFNKKDGLDAYLDSLSEREQCNAGQILFAALMNLIKDHPGFARQDEDHAILRLGKLTTTAVERLTETMDSVDLADEWAPERSRYLFRDRAKAGKEAFIDFKSMYIKKHNADRGNIVHYYLSLIKTHSPSEKQRAREKTVADFGTLLPVVDILQLLDKTDLFLAEHHAEIFASRWQVFTEQTVYNAEGKELRIDRLLVDKENKEIVIIDFKTGESFDESQMQEYEHAIRLLPAFTQAEYSLQGIFIEIKID